MKQMAKEHNSASFLQGPPGTWTQNPTYRNGGWAPSPIGPTAAFVSKNYFDLAGLTMDEKTLFFTGATTQSTLYPVFNGGAAGDLVIVCDIMSVRPLTDEELFWFNSKGNFAESGITPEEIIYGRTRMFNVTVDTGSWTGTVLTSDNQCGLMKATASDRIYSYRTIIIQAANTTVDLFIYPERHLLVAEAKEEQEYEYLMRLKRSYELQQSYDED
jgi:hypothetical protein